MMTDQTPQIPEVDTDAEKLAALAEAEKTQGVVDQQTAGAAKPGEKPAS